MPSGGTLTLSANIVHPTGATVLSGGELTARAYVRIAIRDSGVGMSREVAERALEPFFTTKAVGHGTGLGLSMVYGFVRQSGGALDLRSAPGQGTTITLYFPAAAARLEAPAAGATAMAPVRPPHEEVVLVVEDDPAVRRLCVRSVEALGFRTLEAEHGPAALAVLHAGARVDVVLSDIVMPGGMTGTELAAAIQRTRPEIPVVFMSGYHADMLSGEPRTGGAPLLTKPFSLGELAEVLSRTLAAGPAEDVSG
jgi:CheY-like chemotaxis protein